jgi:hypothetical protein
MANLVVWRPRDESSVDILSEERKINRMDRIDRIKRNQLFFFYPVYPVHPV